MSNNTASVGQTLGQSRALAVSSGKTTRRPSSSIKFAVESSSGAQSTQRPQRTQTRIFTMTADEAQANPDSITSIISVFGESAQVLFDYRAIRSFISTSFVLHTNRELTTLKSKLIVTTPMEKR